MQYKRILGVDYGDVRIGLALSDLLRIIASPYEVFPNVSQEQSIKHICDVVKNNEVDTIVFGLPLNMDSTEGVRAKITREFADKVKNATNVNVVFQDERLSSVEAEDLLIDANVSREERKKIIDKLSASIILESYMNIRSKK